ncbi:MAG: hypothetical protein H8E13_09675 [Actinobacteria bacterium]|nr:hypothetical protein [Actinomycetota bacterium]
MQKDIEDRDLISIQEARSLTKAKREKYKNRLDTKERKGEKCKKQLDLLKQEDL